LLVIRPTSPVRTVTAAPQVLEPRLEPKPVVAPEPFIDEGPPLPVSYDTDLVRALLQDPFRVFVYWEVRERSLKSLMRFFSPDDAASFRIVLKLNELEGGSEAFFDVGLSGRYWMLVFPDRVYEFEIGVRSPLHGYISLVRSNRVRTPRGTVSPRVAEEEPYKIDPPRFLQLLEASGFDAEQTISLTTAAAGRADSQFTELETAIQAFPEALRAAVLVAAAGGELSREMIEALPEPLRSQLLELMRSSGGRVAAAGLVHYIPELLRELSEDELEWIGGRLSPSRVAAGPFIGGSENLSFPGGELRGPRLPRRFVPGSGPIPGLID
jgi:uncharacterized protein DUF4912